MSRIAAAAKAILQRVELFSKHVLKMPLYAYQVEPLKHITQSVLNRDGLEFLLVFPRQSGKNEAVAHLFVYLLNLFQRVGGNIVFGAIGDGVGRGLRRLEKRLENNWNRGKWAKAARPIRRILGNAAAVFLSTSPQAHSRGETAHWLLVIDELQDNDASHIDAVFNPMRASTNATRLNIGTVRFTHDALWKKKQELERLEAQDGIKRVFIVKPDQVTAANPHYERFLDAQIKKYGRQHPIIKSEYFLEPIDGSGGLFPAQRRALMAGDHERRSRPEKGKVYVATIDVGGQDEAATDAVAQLENPGRDWTVCYIHEVEQTPLGPKYRSVDVFVDQGSRHFQSVPGRESVFNRLVAFLEHWRVAHIVGDESGVGEGIIDALKRRFPGRVTGFKFTRISKAGLGNSFLSVVETGRYKHWTGDEDGVPLTDAWWFFTQAEYCGYEVRAGGSFERDLRWSVPATTKVDTPAGAQDVHDDRLVAAALVAIVDDLFDEGIIRTGSGRSAQIPAKDPLDDMSF